MNKEDMIRMANEAGWQYAHGESGYEPLWKFAVLVASAEREACAKACEDAITNDWEGAVKCAEDIRARGQA